MQQFDVEAERTLEGSINSYEATNSIIDLTFGLPRNWISSERVHLGLNAGWQQHLYNNFWQWKNPSLAPTPNGDLIISGWFFGGRLDF